MKRFLVLSDTHVPVYQRDLPKIVYDLAPSMDGVIALGDFVDLDTVLTLQSISKEFHGVFGNVDRYEVKMHLPEYKIILVEKLTIALIHGWGPPWDLRERILEKLSFDRSIDVIIYGHTHEPFDGMESGKRFLNPGTATPGGTYAVMEINGDELIFDVKKV